MHVLPYLSETSQQCINDGATDARDRTLTVQLRVGDHSDDTFPCSMVPKIFGEWRYEQLLIVKDQGYHQCMTSWTNSSKYRDMRIQDTCCTDIATDFCTMMKATSLFVGHSTLPEMAALLSNRVRHVYHGGHDWEPWLPKRLKGIYWCTSGDNRIWPQGPILRQFDHPGYDAGAQDSFPEDEIIRKDSVKCSI